MVPPPVKSEAVAHLRGVSFEPPEDVPRSSFGRWGGTPVRMLADARMLRPSLPHLRFAYGLPSDSQAYGHLSLRAPVRHPVARECYGYDHGSLACMDTITACDPTS